ncbi:Growth differentiation factor 7 [Desmophyllum pertusum]|uniref:Growth differentiation factor 7 n=1 Tax=Desmophyllum pertusum TaxID=174260 RepID=A0A9X0CD98_9CNID|nr:Growth differentiation factor 7 [Desmophyllum pertusum]
MKPLCLLYISPILLLGLAESCCVEPSSGLKRKWELWTRPFLRKRSVDIAQKRLLSILGLENFPRPGRHVIPHKFMLELYRNFSSGNYKGNQSYDMVPNTVVGIVDQEHSDNSVTPTSQQVFYFNVSNIPSSHTIVDAELRVLRLATIKEKSFVERHGTTYRAKLYGKRMMELPNMTPFESSSNLELLDSLAFDIADRSSENWNVFSVKKSAEKWQKASAKFHQLELRVESALSGELIPPEKLGFSKAGRLHNKHALLVVYTSDGRKLTEFIRKPVSKQNKAGGNAISLGKSSEEKQDKDRNDLEHTRVRRDAKSKTGGNSLKKRSRGSKSKRRRKKDSCRRKPLYVDFNQLGWSNWVIAPRGYSAFFCQGLCEFPIDNHLKPTNHATVQTILNSVAPSLAPQACCSPNKFSAISILFIDTSDNIVYKKYEDMVVERCGCK